MRPSRGGNRTRRVRPRTSLSSSLPVWLALAGAGCLATNEFDLKKKAPEPSAAAPSATAPVEPLCDENARSCKDGNLLQCVSGRWQLTQQCTPDQRCSTPLGRCIVCEPSTEYRCNLGRLERCQAEGGGFELVEDCLAAGKLCDEQLSYDRCLECRATDRRCSGATLHRCSGGQFVDAGACELGPCQVVDGRMDHCPECPEPGREACGVGARVVCSPTLELEEIETCAAGCAFDGGVTHCL